MNSVCFRGKQNDFFLSNMEVELENLQLSNIISIKYVYENFLAERATEVAPLTILVLLSWER
jgi:hypothetical protein